MEGAFSNRMGTEGEGKRSRAPARVRRLPVREVVSRERIFLEDKTPVKWECWVTNYVAKTQANKRVNRRVNFV